MADTSPLSARAGDRGDGRLVVVATPIGNLGDLSERAAVALRTADLVAAEDTRRTGRLLAHVGATTPQISYHEHNEESRLPALLERIAAGGTVALVSDAGTPAVSDPGYRLVRACLDAGLCVEAVPGPSALLNALVVAGLPTDRFVFEGFLPRRGGRRRVRLEELAQEPRTAVLYVAPHRAAGDLADLASALGDDRPAALCRELTKLHEEVWRGTLGELAERAAQGSVRGEVTLVVGGAPARRRAVPTPDELAGAVASMVGAGVSKRTAIAQVAADAGVPRRDVYQAVVDEGGSSR
ncbi:MAG TPA: 16S rRNA (cytidine(1402)-2'-O)-methyltransferase [Nitriliruptorales bacterium]|nr:16S rRNA (cytidine(1402)-2'-O)-methyltransferase [Nitriliruptorales bacterium]